MRVSRRSAMALLSSVLFSGLRLRPAAAAEPTQSTKVTLPPDIKWETNNDDPFIGSEKAIRGGRFNYQLGEYPLTFRLMGPNSNDAFTAWNRLSTFMFMLVEMHPVTDKFIPMLATHWSVQKDQKTIYFKLDPDARWSDGRPLTADDFVFTWQMMLSPFIVDPFYNSYAKQYIQSVDKIDDYTLRIVGTRPSWRPLYDYGMMQAMPAHAIHLDKDWVTRTNNEWQVAAGPYVVTNTVRGESVTFTRVKNWWGDKKRYFQGRYNFDQIYLKVIPSDRQLDYLRLGEIDLMEEPSPRAWRQEYDFPAASNGWVQRARIFTDNPAPLVGWSMNLQAPIFQDRNFRIAMQYLYNFDRVNKDLLYGDYYRENSFFEGTVFANPKVKAYPFDPKKAEEYLAKAGYHRPKNRQAAGFWASLRNTVQGLLFTRSDDDDMLVNAAGEKASFTLTYGNKTSEQNITVLQQEYRKAGVDMRLQLLEPGTLFEHELERKYEMTSSGWVPFFYPDPRQSLGSEFKAAINNNDIWGFGNPEVDRLIKIYEESLDANARLQAMYRIDQIVHDEAFFIPGSTAPYLRIAYWAYIDWPEFYLPKRTTDITDYMVFWINPDKKTALAQAMKDGSAFPIDTEIDKDYFHVKDKYKT